MALFFIIGLCLFRAAVSGSCRPAGMCREGGSCGLAGSSSGSLLFVDCSYINVYYIIYILLYIVYYLLYIVYYILYVLINLLIENTPFAMYIYMYI